MKSRPLYVNRLKAAWTFSLAGVLLATTLTPARAVEAITPFTVQAWHSGIWVSWDRAQVKSAVVFIQEQSTISSMGGFQRNSSIDEFTYLPFDVSNPIPPIDRRYFVSIFNLSTALGDAGFTDKCIPFTTMYTKGVVVRQPPECLSETIFQVNMKIPSSTTGKIVQNPTFFVGSRKKVTQGEMSMSDRQSDPRIKKVMFFDSLFTGLPKKAAVRVEGYLMDGKKSRWQYIGGVVASSPTNMPWAIDIPAWPAFADKYRFSIWDPAKKKAVYFSKAFSVNKLTATPSQATGPIVEPVTFRVLGS